MTITASKIELAATCPGAFTLPWRDSPNAYSEAGSERHAADEAAIRTGDVPAEYTDRWPGLTWRAEVKFMYDIATDSGRELGQGSDRKYGDAGPFEVPGTADVVGRAPGVLVILDKKSFEEVTPAAANGQVRFLALAAARSYRHRGRIFVAIKRELADLDVAELDPLFDLDVIAHATKKLVLDTAAARARASAGEPVRFQIGRHCRWCPAFESCPQQGELIALTRRPDDDPELMLASTFLDERDAPDVYRLWKRIGILHKRIGQSLFAYAANTPIPLGGGKMFGKVSSQGNEKLDGDVVYEVVKEQLGQEAADAAVIRSATKKRLEAAVKGTGGTVAPKVRKVLEQVRARGGATREDKETIEEFTPQLRAVND